VHNRVFVINKDHLKPHERIIKKHVKKLGHQIAKDGFINDPVIVDKGTMIILDGHHRYKILQLLGMSFVPVYFCRLWARCNPGRCLACRRMHNKKNCC